MDAKDQMQTERGVVLVAILTVLVPLVLLVGAFASTMLGHNSALQTELDQEIALLAAEAGVDEAIHEGRIGALTDGARITRDLGWGQTFDLDATYLRSDARDNDSDGDIDEEDEDVFQVVVSGRYRGATRRLAAYLGPVPLLPRMDAAFSTQDPSISIRLSGATRINGWDTNLDGSPGPGPHVPGIAIAPPGTVPHLDSELTGTEENKVHGTGGPPSLGLGATIDVVALAAQLQNIANVVLTSDRYSSFTFGDPFAGTSTVTYREGDVHFRGNTLGAGVLVVTGDLQMQGEFRFAGVIVVLGRVITSSGTAQVYGSILQGENGGVLDAGGTLDIRYSTEAIQLANAASGRYVAFNGWQELSKP